MDGSDLGGNSPRVDVVEVTKGASPLDGTITLSYRDSFTEDVAFDASEDEVRNILKTRQELTRDRTSYIPTRGNIREPTAVNELMRNCYGCSTVSTRLSRYEQVGPIQASLA